jgi:hypothetical protein
MHGNKDWAFAMFIVGLTAIFISAFFGAKKVMVCTAAGYVVSFIAGIVFNFNYDFIVDGVLQDSRYTAWLIWTVSFLALVIAGVVWEVVSKRMKRIREVL